MIRTLAWTLAFASALGMRQAQGQDPPIDTLALKAHTHFLAHDLLRGRASGSEGARLAALYIASVCRALGLGPVNGTYLHPLPLEEATVRPGTRLRVSGTTGTVEFDHPRDFVPNVGTRATLVDVQGPAVFVGAERDLARGAVGDLDLNGTVAVTLGLVHGPAADTLSARGVTGMVHLVGDEDDFALYARSRGPSRLYHRSPDVHSSFLPRLPSLIAGPQLARTLLAGVRVGQDDALVARPLPWSIGATLVLERRPIDDVNVACHLSGADAGARDTAIAFTAHYDHLGVSVPDASGDSIYNGFSDNAAGVAMLLGIAQAAARGRVPPLRHSVLFLFFSGEERGLLGSDHFVTAPPWPLERMAAVINLDAGAPPGAPVSWRLAGVDSSGIGGVARAAAESRGWAVTTSPPRPNSDYFPFVRKGVPAMFIIPGAQPYEGLSADSSKALRQRWDHYHRASDEWAEDFPFGGLARYAEYALLIARALDDPGRRGTSMR